MRGETPGKVQVPYRLHAGMDAQENLRQKIFRRSFIFDSSPDELKETIAKMVPDGFRAVPTPS
jgi:hypothetical protein